MTDDLKKTLEEQRARNVEINVRVNGRLAAVVSVPRDAGKQVKEFAALAHPEVNRQLGSATVKGFVEVGEDEVNIIA